MKKTIIATILTLALILAAVTAFAATTGTASRMEEIEYKGFGIVKAELTRDCDWYASAAVTLTDADGNALNFDFIGGEEDDLYLRAADIVDGASYTLSFALEGAEQRIAFDAVTGQSCKIATDDSVSVKVDKEKCDVCGQTGHDDDFCPTRVTEEVLNGDPAAMARFLDIELCERCGGIGHDEENCPAGK